MVARIREEREIARLCLLEAGHADDVDVGRGSLEAAAQPFGEIAKLQMGREILPSRRVNLVILRTNLLSGRASTVFSTGLPACSHAPMRHAGGRRDRGRKLLLERRPDRLRRTSR